MAIKITMPRLSDTMEQGTVVKWHVKEGDKVSSGDVVADIETDKATMEQEVFDDGVVARLAVGEGEAVGVGQLIMVIAEEGEDAAEAAKDDGAEQGEKQESGKQESKKQDDEAEEKAGSGSPAESRRQSGGEDKNKDASTAVADRPSGASANGAPAGSDDESGGRIFASPLARKIAADEGVDLARVKGTGPSGRITRRDVEAAVEQGDARAEEKAPSSAPEPLLPASGAKLEEKTVSLSNMRATIAKRLIESKTRIPHYQVTVSARMDSLNGLRAQLNEQLEPQGVKLSVNDFLVRACALAMHEHPLINASWSDDGPSIRLHGRVNVGVAISLPEERGGGLVVATLRDADRTGLRQISAETKRLAKKAREKGLSVEEMSDSTFTISNLGMYGVDHFTAIINPPNAAILAVGRAIERPFVEEDEDGEPRIVVGSEMAMTMSSDHRIIDGAAAAQYLGTVKQLLENPATLLV